MNINDIMTSIGYGVGYATRYTGPGRVTILMTRQLYDYMTAHAAAYFTLYRDRDDITLFGCPIKITTENGYKWYISVVSGEAREVEA